jgi:hypothetical protein
MSLIAYLNFTVEFQRASAGRDNKWPYLSTEDFILKHGKLAMGRKLPKGYTHGRIKQCFYNSQMMLMDHFIAGSGRLTYVEGYVASIIPVHHGWLVDTEGNVIDLTLRSADENTEYFGVAFNTDYVRRRIVETGLAGTLIDAPWNCFPLLTGRHTVEEALQPAVEKELA